MPEAKSILLGHGGGGSLMVDLITRVFLPQFDNPYLRPLNDQALLEIEGVRFAFTTDSYVVTPIFFPGGDIGCLAVNGTVNDLAVGGAKPLFLSAALILEEGFPIEALERIVLSMKRACEQAGVLLVTGDTKVVDRGKGDKVFINTSGLGVVAGGVEISANRAKPGDKVLLSGAIGAHGIAIMSAREGLEFESQIVSDTAPLTPLVMDMLEATKNIHCMRDPTRGGLASTLNEIAAASKVGIRIYEDRIPIEEGVAAACGLLGLDPLYVANEGKLVAVVAPEGEEDLVLERMRRHPLGREASIIGEVTPDHPGMVVMTTKVGGRRVIDMLSGEQLPRIC